MRREFPTKLYKNFGQKISKTKELQVIPLLIKIPIQTLQTVQKLLTKFAKQKRASDNFVRREFPTKLYKAQQNLFQELQLINVFIKPLSLK